MTTRHQLEYQHIRYVLLADPDSTDIEHFLRGENRTSLRLLKNLIRRPGLELQNITFVNEEGDQSNLTELQVEELKAIESFKINCQNWYGPPDLAGYFDITTTTREDFLSFISKHPNLEDNPVLEDNDLMIRSYDLRIQSRSNNNNNNNNRPRSNSARSS